MWLQQRRGSLLTQCKAIAVQLSLYDNREQQPMELQWWGCNPVDLSVKDWAEVLVVSFSNWRCSAAVGSMMQQIERELQYKCGSGSGGGSIMGSSTKWQQQHSDEGQQVQHQYRDPHQKSMQSFGEKLSCTRVHSLLRGSVDFSWVLG